MGYGGINNQLDAAVELGRNLGSKHHIQPEYGDGQAGAGQDCRTRPSRETEFLGTNGDREIIIFPVQLPTSRIGNLTQLILIHAICDGPYIHADFYFF